jgi:hypothetical protein
MSKNKLSTQTKKTLQENGFEILKAYLAVHDMNKRFASEVEIKLKNKEYKFEFDGLKFQIHPHLDVYHLEVLERTENKKTLKENINQYSKQDSNNNISDFKRRF